MCSGSKTYGVCQTACNKGAEICYKLAGVIFGEGFDSSCSLAQGGCMVACTPLLIAP